jgi:hypothetical protein
MFRRFRLKSTVQRHRNADARFHYLPECFPPRLRREPFDRANAGPLVLEPDVFRRAVMSSGESSGPLGEFHLRRSILGFKQLKCSVIGGDPLAFFCFA